VVVDSMNLAQWGDRGRKIAYKSWIFG